MHPSTSSSTTKGDGNIFDDSVRNRILNDEYRLPTSLCSRDVTVLSCTAALYLAAAGLPVLFECAGYYVLKPLTYGSSANAVSTGKVGGYTCSLCVYAYVSCVQVLAVQRFVYGTYMAPCKSVRHKIHGEASHPQLCGFSRPSTLPLPDPRHPRARASLKGISYDHQSLSRHRR